MKDPILKNLIEFKNAQSIVVSGDIHGDFTQGATSIDKTYRKNSKYYHKYQQPDSMEPNGTKRKTAEGVLNC